MSRRSAGKWEHGQSISDYAILLGCLAVVVLCVVILTGPGLDQTYDVLSKRLMWLERETQEEPPACARLMLLGDLNLHEAVEATDDEMSLGHLVWGGTGRCGQVISASGGSLDPLLNDLSQVPAQIRCVSLEGDVSPEGSLQLLIQNGDQTLLQGEFTITLYTLRDGLLELQATGSHPDLPVDIDSATLSAMQAADVVNLHLTDLGAGQSVARIELVGDCTP